MRIDTPCLPPPSTPVRSLRQRIKDWRDSAVKRLKHHKLYTSVALRYRRSVLVRAFGDVNARARLRCEFANESSYLQICIFYFVFWRDIPKSGFAFLSHLFANRWCVKAKKANGMRTECELNQCYNQMFKCRLHNKHQYTANQIAGSHQPLTRKGR